MNTKLIIASVLVASTAYADHPVEIGGSLGAHAFSRTTELGVADDNMEPGPVSSILLGGHVAVQIKDRFAVESELAIVPTKDDVLGDSATMFGLGIHARYDLIGGRVRPFVVAGVGVSILRATSPQMDNDADKQLHWGGGVRWALNDHLGMRVDLRHDIVPGRTHNGATSEFEVTAGFTYVFGKAAPKAAPIVLEPGDRDGDGIDDDTDQCPDNKEDVDNFKDGDGCPDPDNDGDTILDVTDQCPFEAENKNGYKDSDGCPDTLLAELAGIGFERDSAVIDIDSAPILERAYSLLAANPSLTVEVSGHTSSEGGDQRNLGLSLDRAEAVKAYLVKRGIAADRVQTVGHGSDQPIADNRTAEGRKQNRRIEFRILSLE